MRRSVIAEIRQIARRVTVLRDGKVRGSRLVDEICDAELLAMIVGRTLGSVEFAESRLYAADYDRRYRPIGPAPRFPEAS